MTRHDLRRAWLKSGLTQKEFCAVIQINPRVFRHYLKGDRRMSRAVTFWIETKLKEARMN